VEEEEGTSEDKMSASEIAMAISALTSFKDSFELFFKREEAKTLQVEQKSKRRSNTIADIAKSSLTEFDKDNPALVIENIDGFSKLTEISYMADEATFQPKGLLVITLDDVPIYELKSLEVLPIVKGGQTISFKNGGRDWFANKKLKFLITSSDGSEVKLAVTVTYSR